MGLDYFNQAITIDPDFALAYAGLADACLLTAYYSFKPAKEVMPKAKQSAETAIRLDSSLCEPYSSLGFYYGFYEWNWAKAKKNFCKAIELNPGYVTGHFWYSMLHLSCVEKNFKEAQIEGKIAIKLEPLSAIAHAIHVVNYYVPGEYDEAIRIGKIGIDLDANSYLAYRMTGLAYVGLKKLPEAIELLQHALQLSNRFQWSLFDLAWAYSQNGNFLEMKELINELDARSATEYISPFHRGSGRRMG
jgi:tetratricopeptide (TPR) repeat protein